MKFKVNSRHYSSNANSYQSKESKVTKTLLRQFLILIHPDFFVQFKNEQEINTRNYGNLQGICDSYENYQGDIKQKARTLVFYLKPTDVDPTPRRVKISIGSLYKIEISIVEILETLGIETSYSRATDEKGAHPSFVSISNVELETFLDSLTDRKELMVWRLERSERLDRLRDVVKGMLGVEAVEFRYSWSAENNTILLQRLLHTVESRYQDLNFPWAGLTLVLSPDDCSEMPVSAMEAQVKINPSDVPQQWLNIFQQLGDPSVSKVAIHSKKEIIRLEKLFELAGSVQLKLAVRRKIEEALRSQIDEGSDECDQRTRMREEELEALSGLKIKIRRGFTCSKSWYLYLLRNIEDVMMKVIEVHINKNNSDGQKNNDDGKRNNNDISNESHRSDDNTTNDIIDNSRNNDEESTKTSPLDTNISNTKLESGSAQHSLVATSINVNELFHNDNNSQKIEKNVETFSFLQYLPLEIHIVGKMYVYHISMYFNSYAYYINITV
jgi:hypothetical protein